jgi:adenosylhomocysteine nucleosidase
MVVLAPMQPELRPFVKAAGLQREASEADGLVTYGGEVADTRVTATLTRMGTAAATTTAEAILDRGDCDHLLVVGIAGGLDPALPIGELVVPARVVGHTSGREHRPTPLGRIAPARSLITTDDLIVDPDVLQGFGADGFAAVDMETSAIAEVCDRRGVPWTAFRGISDHGSTDGIDLEVFALSEPDGTANPRAVAKFVATRPWRIPTLARLGRGMQAAVNAAVRAAIDAIETSDPNDTSDDAENRP